MESISRYGSLGLEVMILADDRNSHLLQKNRAFGTDTQGLKNPRLIEILWMRTSPSLYPANPSTLTVGPLSVPAIRASVT